MITSSRRQFGALALVRAAGAAANPAGAVSQPFVAPQGQVLSVNGEDVQVFEFASAEEADTVSQSISADGSSIGPSRVGWVAPPHFYKASQLIVIYVGSDDSVISALQKRAKWIRQWRETMVEGEPGVGQERGP